jgi:hypothetical protein
MIGVSDAAKRLGVSRPTLRKKIAMFGVPTYSSPIDRRTRMIRMLDVERLLVPILEQTRSGGRAGRHHHDTTP